MCLWLRYNVVSSVNFRISKCIKCRWRLLQKTKKIRGPRHDPCGVPYGTSYSLDRPIPLPVLHLTLSVLPYRYDLNHSRHGPRSPYFSNFLKITEYSKVSNTLDKSKNALTVCLPNSILFVISLTSSPMACSHKCFTLKPYWLS